MTICDGDAGNLLYVTNIAYNKTAKLMGLSSSANMEK